jgi:NAD(P)-dependent dehydrogenase (short-subunit alcohol dehydrogenase family)
VNRFTGRVALLTAAGSGIGAATARRLASEDATVVVTDVQVERGQAVVEELVASGAAAEFLPLDVTSASAWTDCVAHVLDRHGRIDVLHLNAGRNIAGSLQDLSDELWDHQVDLALRSTMLGARACLPALRAAAGSVVATTSVHALRGMRTFPAYAAAKGGIESLFRQLAVDYGPQVRFNVVAPGAIVTALWADIGEEARAAVVAQTPMARLGQQEDVAAAVAFLASADASFITGVSLVVDGGRIVVGG